MYTEYFGIHENPFSITPDPRYVYMSKRHREALAHLIFGVGESGGFMQLTGEIGTGKTTLTRVVLDQVPDTVDIALIINPRQTALEFVASICDELRIPYSAGTSSLKTLIDALNAHLLESHAKGRRTVLIVDEAQNLSTAVLEQIRLLSNLESSKDKLLHIVLIGQPELKNLLAHQELRQLAQRITARYHLLPLSREETAEYIQHRLAVAGLKRPLFTRAAIACIHKLSGGIPRLINVLCDRAMLGAYAQDRLRIDAGIARRAAREVMGGEVPRTWARKFRFWGPAVAMLALSGIVWMIVSWSFNHSWSLLQSIPGTVTRSAPGTIAQSAVGGESPTTFASMAVPVTEPANATVTEVNSLERVTAIAEEAGSPADEGIEAVQIDLKALLQDPDTPTDTNTAFTTLFRIWNLSEQYRPGMLACDQAAEAGLRCWHDKGTWNNLRSFNRPAVIELVDSSGTRHHLVVSRLEEKMATLNIAGRELDFPLSDIDRYWFGEYLLLWRAPPLIVSVIHLGMRGKAVQWLQDQLDELDGRPPSTHASDVFGPELEARVRAFQRKYRLKEDGVVGEQTLICLSTALNHAATPLLWRPVL